MYHNFLIHSYAAAAAAAKSPQSCATLCDLIDSSPPGSPVPENSPGKNTGVGCHFLFHHSSANGHQNGFHVLSIVNSAAMNIWAHVSFSIMASSGYMPSSGIAG